MPQTLRQNTEYYEQGTWASTIIIRIKYKLLQQTNHKKNNNIKKIIQNNPKYFHLFVSAKTVAITQLSIMIKTNFSKWYCHLNEKRKKKYQNMCTYDEDIRMTK